MAYPLNERSPLLAGAGASSWLGCQMDEGLI
eukprot:CAMPEP_0176187558 /NCGR_PEP_ID=MMETSP0121_2-20121125/2458_1 /TAXON_ID=160619 /ORGANISM="Kryptoperidinium foliaceum, Strain CCMP 1326" /LENGTH=30 /DNA_ID= /DNA_START= /DNA_END= /DNA_ORIENTATION=